MSETFADPAAREQPAPPRERPFRFALLCHQRSGSNALDGLLRNNESIALHGQLFNPFLQYWIRNSRLGLLRYKARPDAMRHFGLSPPLRPKIERALVSLTPQSSSLDDFMPRFWRNFHADERRAAIGFKLHDFQLSDDELTELSLNHLDGVVLLWRRNRLKAAVSWAYAVKTDVWSRFASEKTKSPVLALDLREIEWFVEKTKSEVENWKRVLENAGANWLEMTYEDDVVPRRLKRLYEFFGLDYPGEPEFRTGRLAAPDYRHIANAEEIERRLGSPDAGSLFR